MGVAQASEIVPIAGAQLVGPLPGNLNNVTVFAGGMCVAAFLREPRTHWQGPAALALHVSTLIGLTLAARAREVVGVEIVEPAVADAIENARLNDVLNARFYAGDIRLAMRDLVEEAGRPDVAVVDPPRAGLSQKVVRRILEAQPSRIVYVSCNPTTLAPNAAQMVEAGYRLVRVRPVDLFPQTPHIESVALLERA